jgi:UDPglucose 6-dehydrogenase
MSPDLKSGDDAAGTSSGSAPIAVARIAVVGTGYVGLTTAVCLAHLGHRVVASDIDARKVDMLSNSLPTILEDGLPELLAEGVGSGRLSFTTDTSQAADGADFVFLCVPTPQGADGSADLSFVEDAAGAIAPQLKPGAVVVTKSTVPVGSVGVVVAALDRPDTAVVSNPEFLREGRAVHDWLNPDRVVIGSDDRAAAERVATLYEPLAAPILITDAASSETIKYACNAFLAAKVSFVNAIANLCGAVGADAVDVIRGMSYDRRIGADHLYPGPGWGGSCFPKDTSALIRIAEEHGYDFGLLKEAIAANNEQFERVANKVEEAAGGELQGSTVAVWGLTFKAGTDDLRESPALAVLRHVAAKGASIRAFDPTLPDPDNPSLKSLRIHVTDDPYSACEGARVLVVLTEWPEFKDMDLRKVAAAMATPAIVDARNVIEPNDARAAGCSYAGLGRS